MAGSPWIKVADVRGAARLAVDATLGVTDLVEAVHHGIARTTLGSTPTETRRAGGVAGFVYRGVRGVTRLVGGGLGLAGAALESMLGSSPESSPARDAVLAALNGVIGDHLDATGNPLALPMQWRVDGRALAPDATAIATAFGTPRRRLFVFVHGLCLDDRSWLRGGHDRGQALARDLDGSAVHLRYNTGRAIGRNGAELAASLEALVDAWPVALDDVCIVAHSMGGLVVRSALHHALARGLRWPALIRDVVSLGTPHHGAPLERGGHAIDRLLEAHPLVAPFARIGRLRSRGIADLRHGRVLEDDADAAAHVPLPPDVAFHAIAASIGGADGTLVDAVVGDGLVPVDSALGVHGDPSRDLRIPEERRHLVRGVGHIDLLGDAGVYARLAAILG
ncbi:esterase/lipase family protein [Tahibacter soli]|uniref:GPI inositol-deacylase PGAP1-like alpha/beta domain-containing protein n=1 Tax=Tahibacter soli TaxID=2983605 RepID=A0A9X3YSE6_9GAMM|nr:hypothetical protein [Tahibacter soli]MDC8016133.1 hypothetical protein [Tahibacter soli]